jgi:dTDP-4-dehydrorhamnose reductase
VKCLILGSQGQLGRALAATAPANVNVVAPAESDCSITDPQAIKKYLEEGPVAWVFNAAAYTAVDVAESHADDARQVNASAVGQLASLCRQHGADLLHISTDFVFDGTATTPYREDAVTNPLSVYGQTKLEGDKLAQRENPNTRIVRTAWVYEEQGKNFVNTMLRLMGERDELKVVSDQTGTPTYARNLARALWRLSEGAEPGIYNFTDAGETSWHGFALAIRDEANAIGLLKNVPKITPIRTKDYPTPARRPAYSVLDKSKIWTKIGPGQDWRDALRDMLQAKMRAG